MFSSNTSQVEGGYQISRSLRFNSADSAYLTRTFSSAGNRRTWTWSAWVKQSEVDGFRNMFTSNIFSAATDSMSIRLYQNVFVLQLFNNGSGIAAISTNAAIRDYSAWYHFVCAVDTTQATDSNRVKLYINGVQQTVTGTYPAQNYEYPIGSTSWANAIGAWNNGTFGMNGYMTDMYFIDGQALTPSSFGETNAQTGVWQPKAYSGSYGTNGFYLNFSDNSNTTAATLGKDYSGNGNNWTPNNFSVTAGVGNDSMVDTPTPYGVDTGAGGEVRGNYSTMNPLSTTAGTYTQGNLRYAATSSWRRSNATISRSDGKWYWEVTLGNAPLSSRNSGSAWNAFGFGVATAFNSTTDPSAVTDAVVLADNGWFKNFSGSWTDGGTAFSSGDVLSIAVDLDANTFTFRRNNTQITTGTIGGTAGRELVPIIISYNDSYGVMDCNFGQRPFAYTAPSGFKALCTQNLPTPTIGATTATQAGKFFNPVLYTGNASTNNITGVGFQPDFVWIKQRDVTRSHGLYDAVRGVLKDLQSDRTDAEVNYSGSLTSFNSDGFSLGSATDPNASGGSFVAWNWKANGSGSTNTAGSITSTVSANTTSGFSIVRYNGTSANATIGHGLGVAPKMIIRKYVNDTDSWYTYHASLGADKYLALNETSAATTSTAIWQNTAPTSTVFSIGSGNNNSNSVAYCFAEVPGYSAFGSYTGNGSTDGPFVYTGFRPAFVLIKASSATSDWWLYDTKRATFNVANAPLYPNGSFAESPTSALDLDILSNGFKSRSNNGTVNGNGVTYVYACFAENPFKYSLAR